MTDSDSQEVARRTFLKRMATVAGTAPLAPALFGAAAAQAPATPPTAGPHGNEGAHDTERLAAYAAAVRYEDLPPAVLQRAKDCIADTVAAIIYGAELPWSKMIIAYARRNSAAGTSSIL